MSLLPDTVGRLCPLVQSYRLQSGITQSLCAKANAASAAARATASNILDAFINEVTAQRGNKIAIPIADVLIHFAADAKLLL